MGVSRGTSIRILYLAADPDPDAARLEREHDRFDVESAASTDAVREHLADADCLVCAHGDGVDAFATLADVQTIAPDLPVVVVTDTEEAAERAFDTGVTDVLRGDPADPPLALLTHRIGRAVEGRPDAGDLRATVPADAGSDTTDWAFTARVLDALPSVFYVLDLDGTFRNWNDRLPAVTVYDEADLAAMDLTDLIAPEDRPAIANAIEQACQEGRTETREASVVTARGDRVTYEFDVTPLTDATGRVEALAGTARDVTDRKLREQRLGVLARVLRHNVRNQMTVVQGRSERIVTRMDGGADAAAIDRAATKLVELSDKARRVEAALRESSSNRRPLDVVAAITQTMKALAREFPDADLALEAPDSLVARTTEGVTFAVEELVRNGVVHSDSETPTVRVTIEREMEANGSLASEAAPGMVAITVADDGPGLPETEQVALAADYETDLDHSTGLGLWLVSWVTTAGGGSLEYHTAEDLGGAAVTLRFPMVGE